MTTKIKSNSEILAMREGGKILSDLLAMAIEKVVPGVSTKEISDFLGVELKKRGAVSAFLGFQGYPEIACISVNEQVVHGLPSKKTIIKDGDVVSVDLGIRFKGLLTDSARTLYVGKQPPENIKRLITGTQEAMMAGINKINGPTKVGDIASAIQAVLDANKLGIVRDLVGHGVGHNVHEDPNIPNYGFEGTGFTLQPGMTVAIEPMATLGDWRVNFLDDGWTVVTRDSSLSAHFEHTVLITDGVPEILTA